MNAAAPLDPHLRKTSDTEAFPYAGALVTFIRISPVYRGIWQAKTVEAKLQMLEAKLASDILLAAWPGRFSQDIFELDDPDRARRALQAARA